MHWEWRLQLAPDFPYIIFAGCVRMICCLKPHGTASFPRVCLPSHQAKFSSAWQSGLCVSFPGCPKADFGPKVPKSGASWWSKCAQLPGGHQNCMVSTSWSNTKQLSHENNRNSLLSFAISARDLSKWLRPPATITGIASVVHLPPNRSLSLFSDRVRKPSQNDM